MGNKAIKFKDNSGNVVYPCPYYPVGSIYMSVNNINPANFFGGTWERLKGRFLLGADDSTYKLGGTGGNTTHNHTTGSHTLTVDEMPSHNHIQNMGDNNMVAGSGNYHSNTQVHGEYVLTTGKTTTYQQITNNTGGGKGHNHGNTGNSSNMPPYLIVYMWKRTA